MRRVLIMLLLSILAGCIRPGGGIETYRFIVANDQLFAISGGSSYGTEVNLLTTNDGGKTWQDYPAPEKTFALCGDGTKLYALTSNAEVWLKTSDNAPWKQIWSSSFERWTYDIDLAPNGDLYLTSNDKVIVLSSEGKLLREIPSNEDGMFVSSFFADDRYLVIEGNPYKAAVIDTETNELISWNEGFAARPDDGLRGPCRIRRHGERFLASRADGIYISEGVLEPWKMLTSEIRHQGFNPEFCRDLISFNAAEDQWLIATGSGIHLMHGAEKRETVFKDVDDAHNLILEITEFDSDLFVSFARLKDCMGIRLEKDLKQWQTLSQNTKKQ